MSRYTAEQIERRRNSRWTIVQIIGAPVQFLIFMISLGFVIYSVVSGGHGFEITNVTVLVKILTLYFMFITGMLWEKDVFGHYVYAPEFFWEDVVSTLLLTTHTAYLVALFMGAPKSTLLLIVIIAYLNYLFNASQYVRKFLKNRQKKTAVLEQAVQTESRV
ncbi:MAG TPA: 2-vinyl bacteriochlorophyllide hydratase [Chloroflexia bacterium]|nr:2-vinyl bacteriochlorophyllide hydratase [Chloroflexia bacterium]